MLTRSRSRKLKLEETEKPKRSLEKDLQPTPVKKTRNALAIFDPLTCFPPEIVRDIFLLLRNEDLFLGCSLVSKSWHSFVQSNFFFEALLVREFGRVRVNAFLATEGALGRLKEDLATNPAFRFNFFTMHLERDQHVIRQDPAEPTNTLNQFIDQIRWQRPKFLEANIDQLVIIKFPEPARDHWLMRIPPRNFEAMDILHMPFVCKCNSWYLTDLVDDKVKVNLLDSDFHQMNQLEVKKDFDLFFGRDYPAGVRYFYGNGWMNGFRFVLPSLCNILELSRELRLAVLKDSPLADIERILDRDPGLLNYTRVRDRRFSQTPLGIAITHENLDVLELFFNRCASASSKALFYALQCYSIEVIRFLFQHGADPNTADEEGVPVLVHALLMSQEAAAVLIKHGANVNGSDKVGTTVLMHVVKKCNIQAVRYLIKRGAKVNAQNKKKQSTLYFALNCDPGFQTPARLEILLNAGANVNTKFSRDDGSKTTALIEAVQEKMDEAVKVLLKHGANCEIKDSNGLNAFDYAKKGGENTKNILSMLY